MHYDYKQRLKYLNLTSIQRRFDRYKIIYIIKALKGDVPSHNIEIDHNNDHCLGLTLKVPITKSSTKLSLDSSKLGGR